MEELAYIRKRKLRGKHRKVRIEDVYDVENLRLAQRSARKGKDNPLHKHRGVRIFDRNPEHKLVELSKAIREHSYRTSEGNECLKKCPCGKERLLHKLPFYPDHIVHHALMRVIMKSFTNSYYYDSSASVKGKGLAFAKRRVERWIDENKHHGRLYYAKMDFVKFYHHIDQKRVYEMLHHTYGDKGIRYLLHQAVTACDEGLGIGLYPIQPIANYYTSPLCREVVALFNVKVMIYCDDVIILSYLKSEVWKAVNYVLDYAKVRMKQEVHGGIGVQIIDERHGLDFVGHVFYFRHTLLRKKIKTNFKGKMRHLVDEKKRYQVASSYKGWCMQCDGFHLWCKIMHMKSFKELDVPKFEKRDADGKRMLEGTKVSASILTDREIIFLDMEDDVRSKFSKGGQPKHSMLVQVEDNGRKFKFFTDNVQLKQTLQYIKDQGHFPFRGTLINTNTNGGLPNYEIR